jgi:hypothetical protein
MVLHWLLIAVLKKLDKMKEDSRWDGIIAIRRVCADQSIYHSETMINAYLGDIW